MCSFDLVYMLGNMMIHVGHMLCMLGDRVCVGYQLRYMLDIYVGLYMLDTYVIYGGYHGIYVG